MKKYLALALAILTLTMVGCTPTEDKTIPDGAVFSLKSTVKSIEDPSRIEVEITESEYAFGIYWVLINSDTKIYDTEGNKIDISEIKVGDIIEITYGGQVMMSYPPQIVAKKIRKI